MKGSIGSKKKFALAGSRRVKCLHCGSWHWNHEMSREQCEKLHKLHGPKREYEKRVRNFAYHASGRSVEFVERRVNFDMPWNRITTHSPYPTY